MDTVRTAGLAGNLTVLTRHTDILMAVAVVGILLVMIIPLPPVLLDLLLTFNITFTLIILLVGLYILKPLELSAFPSILLIATLFRLSLNVASTRIILLNGGSGTGAAGRVIEAFGSFVVGGNTLVGLIVFFILVLINFMVITKGAGRIAEVAARFTLDAMPGKQMSIDADLNAGLIDETEAKTRRQQISREAEYYGAMDGANKFVRGDAVAGIIITLVNILGGLTIGVLQNGLNFAAAAETYTLLTVGDGLVSQIPALILSTAAGIIVSRAGSDANLGNEITAQLAVQPRAILVAAAVLLGFGLVPGLPTVPFLILAALAGLVGLALFKAGAPGAPAVEPSDEEAAAGRAPEPETLAPPPVDPLAIEVGYGLIPLVDVSQDGELLDRIKSIRRQTAEEMGVLVPPVHIQDNLQLKPAQYAILLKGNEVARGELMLNHLLAMNPGTVTREIDGTATREPTYGLPAVWIRDTAREQAQSCGYTVVDLATVVTTHLAEVIRRHANEFLGRQEVQQLLDNLKASHPKVVEELVPNLLTLGQVGKVLQNLVREQIPVRDLLTVLETLADWAPLTKDVDTLSEYVRQAQARTISGMYQTEEGRVPVITLDPSVERQIADAIQRTDHGSYLAMEPARAQSLMETIGRHLEVFARFNYQPVVLCAAHIRLHLRRLAERFMPTLVVLSYNDIAADVTVQSLATVGFSDEN